MPQDSFKESLVTELRKYRSNGLRWAYIINGVLVVAALIANHFLPHGWVAWPAVLAIGMMVMINEAVDRNGQGLPPLLVYGWFALVIIGWVVLAFVFSAIAPILFFVGVPALAVFGFVTWRRERRAELLAEQRRADGRCANCGEAVDHNFGLCGNCGKEVDQFVTLLARVRTAVGAKTTEEVVEHRREVLKAAPPTVAAQRKERALLERKQKPGKPKLPGA
jgi:hypothetical protein